MVFETQSMGLVSEAVEALEDSLTSLPAFQPDIKSQEMKRVLSDVAERMTDNFPYAHPLYAGQMLKPPHPIARLAYMLALFINPNNHALDGGRASSQMEKDVIKDLAAMYGWKEAHLGHLTSGGTMANMEALWIADQIHPGKTIVASSQAHYTHNRLTKVLKIPYQSVPVDKLGRLSVVALEKLLKSGEVGTVVVTLGTTGMGAVDPLQDILTLQEKYQFRIHVDSAYGGYYRLASNLPDSAQKAYQAMTQADSIVVDPHKCGLQPYGCGCILFKDPEVGKYYQHDSPYTYFSSDELHLGEISLECSRAGASAVALWATMQHFPLSSDGEFATNIMSCHEAAVKLYSYLDDSDKDRVITYPETDIVIWAPNVNDASKISALSQKLFDEAAKRDLHLATIKLPSSWLAQHWSDVNFDEENVLCLRSCLMKAEHLEWIDRIWNIYDNLNR